MAQEGYQDADFLGAMIALGPAERNGRRASATGQALVAVLLATLSSCASRDAQLALPPATGPIGVEREAAAAQPRPGDIPKLAPFVVSPPEVVSRLLVLAAVTGRDVVFDLGCGDGRIVIAAARNFGARGVGVDIDAGLIAEAEAAAVAAGVSHLVSFRVQNALEVDLSEATVVALYLLPSGNALLRPKLQRELRRGARVVAHSFDMGTSWRPTKSETFYDDAGLPRIIHLWRITGRR